MENTQNPAEAIRQAESAIRALTEKLTQTSEVSNAEKEDLAQILRLHVVRKARAFDPKRSSLQTYIDRIIRNRIKDYLAAYFAQCRDPRRLVSASEFQEEGADDEGGFGGEPDPEYALRRAGMLPWPADEALVIDVKLVLEDLSEIDRLTCEVLGVTKSLREAARSLGIHVETLRERIGRIRAQFEAREIFGTCPDSF